MPSGSVISPLETFSVTLRGIGRVPAVLPRDLRVGNIVMFNHGKTAEVLEVTESLSGKHFHVRLQYAAAGTAEQPHSQSQRQGKNDPVALSPLPEHRSRNPQVAAILKKLGGQPRS